MSVSLLREFVKRVIAENAGYAVYDAGASAADYSLQFTPAKFQPDVRGNEVHLTATPSVSGKRFVNAVRQIVKDMGFQFDGFDTGVSVDVYINVDDSIVAEISYSDASAVISFSERAGRKASEPAASTPSVSSAEGDSLMKFFKGSSKPEDFGQFWPDTGMDESKKKTRHKK